LDLTSCVTEVLNHGFENVTKPASRKPCDWSGAEYAKHTVNGECAKRFAYKDLEDQAREDICKDLHADIALSGTTLEFPEAVESEQQLETVVHFTERWAPVSPTMSTKVATPSEQKHLALIDESIAPSLSMSQQLRIFMPGGEQVPLQKTTETDRIRAQPMRYVGPKVKPCAKPIAIGVDRIDYDDAGYQKDSSDDISDETSSQPIEIVHERSFVEKSASPSSVSDRPSDKTTRMSTYMVWCESVTAKIGTASTIISVDNLSDAPDGKCQEPIPQLTPIANIHLTERVGDAFASQGNSKVPTVHSSSKEILRAASGQTGSTEEKFQGEPRDEVPSSITPLSHPEPVNDDSVETTTRFSSSPASLHSNSIGEATNYIEPLEATSSMLTNAQYAISSLRPACRSLAHLCTDVDHGSMFSISSSRDPVPRDTESAKHK